jgi:hypothetical protein
MFSLKICSCSSVLETTKIDTKAVVIVGRCGKKKQITRSLSRQAGNNKCTSTPFRVFRVECLIFGYFCFLHTNHTIIINNTKNHSRFCRAVKRRSVDKAAPLRLRPLVSEKRIAFSFDRCNRSPAASPCAGRIGGRTALVRWLVR